VQGKVDPEQPFFLEHSQWLKPYVAGFYAKKANPPLHITPLVKEKAGPRLIYRIGMGVRPADQNWKRQLNRLIEENKPAINKILLDFGVPLLNENDQPISLETATKTP